LTVLWTRDAAVAATGGDSPVDWRATGVSIDTRSLVAGDLFVALTAARDGHDFVADALARGASAAVVARRPEGVAADAPLLVVPDVLDGLRALGAAGRERFRGRVVAVTGSVGKTGTKEMLRAALGAQGNVHAAEKSFNNHWGVPLTLARMAPDADFAVIEIGMNAPGEIADQIREGNARGWRRPPGRRSGQACSTQSFNCVTSAGTSEAIGVTFNDVTPASLKAAMRSRT
jgi:UDP-N-acetylmuramoyl-tripeptide--D-alanyl-D-alanine ligase